MPWSRRWRWPGVRERGCVVFTWCLQRPKGTVQRPRLCRPSLTGAAKRLAFQGSWLSRLERWHPRYANESGGPIWPLCILLTLRHPNRSPG